MVSGRKNITDDSESKVSVPVLSHVFSVALEAPRGDKIPYAKILAFICWLSQQGFNISRISRDQFQSEYMAQLLESKGYNVDKLSLDRTPDGYMATRSVILEQRIEMLHCTLLEDELVQLQRDSVTGKLDHAIGSSKDLSDSFAGSIWNAVLHAPDIVISSTEIVKTMSNVNGPKRQGRSSHDLPSMFPWLRR